MRSAYVRIIITIIIILAIRKCVAWASTLITRNIPERRKPHITPSFSPRIIIIYSKYYVASKLHPQAIGVGLWSPPPCSLFLGGPCLNRATLLEMATCVVTEIIGIAVPSPLPSSPWIHHPSPSRRYEAASWSMKLLPSTPRRPKLSTAKVASLWLCSSKDACPGRA